MTAPAALPELVSYTIACELGPSAHEGSEALADATSHAARSVLAMRGMNRDHAITDFHGRAGAHLRGLGLIPRGRSLLLELGRVAEAIRASL